MALTPEQIIDLDSRCNIELVSVNLLLKSPELFNATLARAVNLLGNGNKVTITGNERTRDGWMEFSMFVQFEGGRTLFIGCIERKPGDPAEFHS